MTRAVQEGGDGQDKSHQPSPAAHKDSYRRARKRKRRDRAANRYSTSDYNAVRNEAPPLAGVTRSVHSDSDESVPQVAQRFDQRRLGADPNGGGRSHRHKRPGLQRAILLEIKRHQDKFAESDVPDAVYPHRANVKAFEFPDNWTAFRDALTTAVEEKKTILIIFEGTPTHAQVRDVERVPGFRAGSRRFFERQGSDRELPNICDSEDLIFDSPFLYSEAQDNRESLAARYVRVWIAKTKFFAVVHDSRHDLTRPDPIPANWNGFQNSMQMIRQEHSIALILLHYYNMSSRWARYVTSAWWLAIDLYSSLYIKMWNKTHNELAGQVEKYRNCIIDDFTRAPITQLSASLHKRQSHLLYLLELKRYQGAVFQRLDMFLSERPGDYLDELKFRVKSMIHQTDLLQKVIELLLKKVDDSLNLLFNITAVNESRSINRLTYLAFIYVPLTFATSVWGMPQFQIAVEWVAVLALPLLVLTLFLVALSYIVARKLDDRKMDKIRARTHYLV